LDSLINNIKTILPYLLSVITGIVLALLFSFWSFYGYVSIILIPLTILYIIWLDKKPKIAIYSLITLAFSIPLILRYFPIFPFGTLFDGTILILSIKLNFDIYNKKIYTNKLNNSLVFIWLIWFVFILLMLFNPMANNYMAWIFSMRGLAFYSLAVTPLIFLYFNKPKDLQNFLITISTFSLIASLWGIKQHFFGVSNIEQLWLNSGAAKTHVLFGKLRVFSFFTDASQFGSNQAIIGTIASISFIIFKGWKKYFFLTISALAFYGMILSGTRTALVIPVIALTTVAFLGKNKILMILLPTFFIIVFSIFRFTYLGQEIYHINRMRTVVRPSKDPSFLVRKDREKKLKIFMKDKAFGNGIGSAGFWAKRFYPNSYLAKIGTDGHYTRIWIESGVIGVILYISLMLFLAINTIIITWKLKNKKLRLLIASFTGSFLALLVSSYTNELMIQFPTGPITYILLAFIYLSPTFDNDTLFLK